jgi:hypothetical protein
MSRHGVRFGLLHTYVYTTRDCTVQGSVTHTSVHSSVLLGAALSDGFSVSYGFPNYLRPHLPAYGSNSWQLNRNSSLTDWLLTNQPTHSPNWTSRHGPHRKCRSSSVVSLSQLWHDVCHCCMRNHWHGPCRIHHSFVAVYGLLLKMYVAYLFVSRSLPSSLCACHNTFYLLRN